MNQIWLMMDHRIGLYLSINKESIKFYHFRFLPGQAPFVVMVSLCSIR
jgi:hypothetical protein